MVLVKNTDNGRILDVPEKELFIYDRSSNFVRVEVEPPKAPEPPVKRKKKA